MTKLFDGSSVRLGSLFVDVVGSVWLDETGSCKIGNLRGWSLTLGWFGCD